MAAGFSLVEVVVALGLLACVLLSIAGLLVLGTRQVRSGRHSSEALAVARDVIEKIEGFGFRQIYWQFGCDAASASCLVESGQNPQAVTWHEQLKRTLPAGSEAEILLEGLDEGGSSTRLDSADGIRVTVTVSWTEGLRPRRVRLVTMRT